jgi:hypothetical protein
MKHVFTLGVECRLLPSTTHVHEGETIAVPSHWTTVAVFGGVDPRGVPRMWQCLPGIVARDDSMAAAREALNRTLHHFPIDGRNLRVDRGQVWSTVADASAPLKAYHLWVPPKDVFWQGPEPVEAVGKVVGGGVGLEWHEGTLYMAPYLAVTILEEFPDGRMVALTVPARWMTPLNPKSALVKDDPPLREFIPELHAKLRSQGPIGANVTLSVVPGEIPHYSLEEVHADTVMGAALAAAGVGAADPAILGAVRGVEAAEA